MGPLQPQAVGGTVLVLRARATSPGGGPWCYFLWAPPYTARAVSLALTLSSNVTSAVNLIKAVSAFSSGLLARETQNRAGRESWFHSLPPSTPCFLQGPCSGPQPVLCSPLLVQARLNSLWELLQSQLSPCLVSPRLRQAAAEGEEGRRWVALSSSAED